MLRHARCVSRLSFVICLPNAQLQLMPACDISSLSGSLWLTLALSGSLWLSLALSGSLSGSLWLTLALSGSLWLSQALSGSPNLLTKPLLGSQGPCSTRSVATALQHFNQTWLKPITFFQTCYRAENAANLRDRMRKRLERCQR